MFRGGGSRQAKCISFHFGLFFFEKKSSSHVSWAPRLQITLPLLRWEFQRILISNGWLRKSFGKSVCSSLPHIVGCSVFRSGWNGVAAEGSGFALLPAAAAGVQGRTPLMRSWPKLLVDWAASAFPRTPAHFWLKQHLLKLRE